MAVVSGSLVYESDTGPNQIANSPYPYKEILVVTPATADDGDTVAITLADYGITNVKSVKGFTHTVDYSHVIVEEPTTSVSSGVLTITIGGSTDNKLRVFLVGGY